MSQVMSRRIAASPFLRYARRHGATRLPFSRSFAQAALDDSSEKTPSKEDRMAKMVAYARTYLADEGSLPSAYLLVKEFGGSRPTALKALNMVEEKQTAHLGQAEEESEVKPEPEVANPKLETPKLDVPEAKPDKEEPKPATSLWTKLHRMANSRTVAAQPAASPPAPDTSESSSSEDEAEEESEIVNLEFQKNPAEPLLQSELLPRHGMFIKFLDHHATESDIKAVFRSCGDIRRIKINRGKNVNSNYTYAFVDFHTEKALKAALSKEAVIRGVKVQTEVSKKNGEPMKPPSPKPSPTPKLSEVKPSETVKALEGKPSEGKPSVSKVLPVKGKPESQGSALQPVKTSDSKALQPDSSDTARHTVTLESIPPASLPQILDALSQYGEILHSHTKLTGTTNTTAYIEFKNEIDRDSAVAGGYVHLGGKLLKVNRSEGPVTTVVRLSNVPSDAHQKVTATYKSYGKVDRVENKMNGVVDIYYNASEAKHMTRILDKLNALTIEKKKLRAMPAPVCYPKSVSETMASPAGLKWVEAQREHTLSNLETSLRKAAVYVQDLRGLFGYASAPAPAAKVESVMAAPMVAVKPVSALVATAASEGPKPEEMASS